MTKKKMMDLPLLWSLLSKSVLSLQKTSTTDEMKNCKGLDCDNVFILHIFTWSNILIV